VINELVPNRAEDKGTEGCVPAEGCRAGPESKANLAEVEARLQIALGQNKPFPSDFWACPELDGGSPGEVCETVRSASAARKCRSSKMESGRGRVIHFDSRGSHTSHLLHSPGARCPKNPEAVSSPAKTFSPESPRTCGLMRGKNDGSLPQPSVHVLAPYCAAYDSNRSNLRSRRIKLWRGISRFRPGSPLNLVWLYAHHWDAAGSLRPPWDVC
jgi:hypothetical protein